MSVDAAHRTDARISAWWLDEPGVARLFEALGARGAAARFVGGCVRNALIGGGDTDLDIAIDRPPEETRALLEAADLPAHPTGVDHGTYTTVIETAEGQTPIEITSLRRDVETDGRRAVVAFTEDWAEDAARRDFTMNALYADGDGVVYDPLDGGLADLLARRLCFIGDAETRIREDALRILRYFRFAARYAPSSEGVEGLRAALRPEDLAAITRLVDLIDQLARERIGHELMKLFAAPEPTAAAALGAERSALSHALAPALDAPLDSARVAERFGRLVAAEQRLGLEPAPLRRLAAVSPDLDATRVVDALRLSRAEASRLQALEAARRCPMEEAGYRYGAEAARDARLVALAWGEIAPRDFDADSLGAIEEAAAQRFPVVARDVMARGVPAGPALGETLRRLETRWIESGFALDRESLLKDVGEG